MRRFSAALMLVGAVTSQTASSHSMPSTIVDLKRSFPNQMPEERATLERQKTAMIACRRAYVGQDYFPQPAIWTVADADTTIYLFGTIHSLPINFDWRSPQLERIIAESQELISETGLPSSIGETATSPEWPANGIFATRVPIAKRVRGERRAKWLGMASMMPEKLVNTFDHLPSWMAAIGIVTAMNQNKDPPMEKGADNQLAEAFRHAKKSVTAIEDHAAVAADVSRIPEGQQRRMLADALDQIGRKETLRVRMAMFNEWGRGEYLPDPFGGPARPGSYDEVLRYRLLGARNDAWAKTLEARMSEPGVILAAVGAAHLQGPESLLRLLAKRGLKVKRISPTTAALPRQSFIPKPSTWSKCNDYLFGT